MNKLPIVLAVLLLLPVLGVDTVVIINTTNGFTDDVYVDSSNPNTNYGTSAFLYLNSQTYPSTIIERSYFKINTSILPSTYVINSAVLYVRGTAGTDSYNVTLHKVLTSGLTEGSITWSNQPCGSTIGSVNSSCSSELSSTLFNAGAVPYFVAYDIAPALSAGETTLSLLLKSSNEALTLSYINAVSTEGVAAQRPYLRINYTDLFLTSISKSSPVNQIYNVDYVWHNFTPVNSNLSNIPCYIEETKIGSPEVETSVGSITNDTESTTLKSGYTYGAYSQYIKCKNSDSSYSDSAVTNYTINAQPSITLIDIDTQAFNGSATVEISYIPTDADSSGHLACIFTIDNVTYSTITADNGIENQDLFGGIALGNHILVINCSDLLGGSGYLNHNFTVSIANFRVCFYTYDDYRDWISNSSVSVSNKPNAVRNTVKFEDVMGKVWLKHNVGLQDYYYCAELDNGCADMNVSVSGVYDVYLADNTNFDANCHPLTINPRYAEYVGKFYLATSANVFENRFISFEDSASETGGKSDLLQEVRNQIFFLLFIVVIVGGAYLGMISGGSGLAVLTFVGIGVAILLYFRGFILSGGLI